MEQQQTTAQTVATRITVALIPRVSDELAHLQGDTGLSKTDLVNRAITLYAFVNAQVVAGRDLLVRDADSQQVVRLL